MAHRRDAEIAEEDFLEENREIPILLKLQAFGRKYPQGVQTFCLFRVYRNKQKMIFSASSASLR
jgi:hypothetical protein